MGDKKLRLELCSEDQQTAISSLFCTLEPDNIAYASFTYLGYEGERKYFFSDREWGEISLKKGYVLYDSVVRIAIEISPSVFNWNYISYDGQSNVICKERNNRLNICSAYTLKVDWDGSFLSIATSNRDFDIRKYLQGHIPHVLSFGRLCHQILCHE